MRKGYKKKIPIEKKPEGSNLDQGRTRRKKLPRI